jgi:alpha-tubulin suppressor-like RCC1 family protein
MRIHLLFSLTLLGFTLGCRDDKESPAAPDAPPAVATTASTLVFTQMSAGFEHSCGVTSDNRLYCWGWNAEGEVGDGTTTDRLVPVPVGGALRFRQVSAGFGNTCAVTTDNRAYCWGFAPGIGAGPSPRLSPALVVGGILFRTVQIDLGTACGVRASDDKAFCWGDNRFGQLGIGNNTGPENDSQSGPHSSKPVAVSGGLKFRHVSPGHQHVCGVTTDNRVFCWGYNRYGQVGDGSGGWLKFKPVRVAGTQLYREVDAGRDFTCAVTTGDRAYCWGFNSIGELGNGTRNLSRVPKAVSGGLSFERVSAGEFHACAETTGHKAYCWGSRGAGALGDGKFGDTDQFSLTPVAVVGGLSFSQVSAGSPDHTCARTPAGVGYCWGRGFNGQLGNGTTGRSAVPVAVSGPI